MNPQDFLNFIRDGGIIGVLVLVLAGGMRGWWVFGRFHEQAMTQAENRCREIREERDFFRDKLVEALQTVHAGVSLAERRHTPKERRHS